MPTTSSTSLRNADSMSSVPARCLIAAGVSWARIAPSRISSSWSQRSASSMTWLETRTAAPSSASSWKRLQRSRRSTGSSPTVGSSRTSRSGLSSSATARLARERWPPLSRLDRRAGVGAEVDRVDRLVHLGVRAAEHAGEEAQVLGDREVVVHAGCLGDVADPPAQRCAARGLAEHAHVAARDLLDADDRAEQRGLAAAARTEQPGHPGADGRRRARPAPASVADDGQPTYLDDVIHHMMNYGDGPLGAQVCGRL